MPSAAPQAPHPTPSPNLSHNPSPDAIVDAAVQRLASQYKAHGDLELYFIRQIAGSQITIESLQRSIFTLNSAADPNDLRIDRLSRAKAREQRQMAVALKELKDLQGLRNAAEHFPLNTCNKPPLADQTSFIGLHPKHIPLPSMAAMRRSMNPRAGSGGNEADPGPNHRHAERFAKMDALFEQMARESQAR